MANYKEGNVNEQNLKEDIQMVLPRAGHSCHSWLFRHGREGGWGGANGVSRPQCINISHTSTEWWDQPLYKSHLHNSRWEGEWGKLITRFSRSFFGKLFQCKGVTATRKSVQTTNCRLSQKKVPFFLKFQLFVGHDDHLDHFGRSWTLLDRFGSQ